MPDWTADDVRALITRLRTTQGGLARLMGIREDAVRQDWCRHGVPEKGTARVALSFLAERIVDPPPASLRPDADRDEPCGQAIDPHLDALLARAEAARWQPAEIVTAVMGWAVHTAIEGAGVDAARQLLDAAGELVDIAGKRH